jgi:hypothetical protein
MKHINFLLSSIPEETLDTLAEKIFSFAKVDNYEERSSSNYVNERYFFGQTEKVEFKVMYSDDTDNSDRPFWIRVSAVDRDAELNENEMHNFVHVKLLPAGFRVARMENFGQISEQRIDYDA